jgi:hypothetical protein
MRKYSMIAGASLVACASTAFAQGGGLTSSPCPQGSSPIDQARIAQDVCTQAFDVYQFLAPQLGLALAGGNATLGQGGTLGGIGHASIGLRANAFSGLLPDVGQFTRTTTGARQQELPTKSQIVGLPTLDAAIGIFKGIPLGLTNVGGIDVLVSASYVPTISGSGASVTPDKSWEFGHGARVGLLQESLISPGVAFTYLKRDLPQTSILGTVQSDSLRITNAKVNTTAWRLVASKNLIAFSLAGGIGQDTYDQQADIEGVIHSTVSGIPVTGRSSVPGTKQSLTRTNYFLDLGLNLPVFKIVGELGAASGGTVKTYNSFSGGSADRSLVYGSLGVRLAW